MIEKIKKIFHIKNNEKNSYFPEDKIEAMYNSLGSEKLSIKIGSDLTCFTQSICEAIRNTREKTFQNSGFILPPVHLFDAPYELQENEFQIIINDKIFYTGFTLLNKEDAVFDIIQNFQDICLENIDKIFTNSITEKYMDSVQKNNSRLIWNLSNTMPLWGIKLVLTNLLKEGKSIKNIDYIFEKMCEFSNADKKNNDPYIIAQKVSNECY